MKRSVINALIDDAIEFVQERRFSLPPFARWSLPDWETKGEAVREIVETKLGWDVTDFGEGLFEKRGLLLFTLRNGKPENLKLLNSKIYAEKIMIVGVDQVTPMHLHWTKTEDIINRGGGRLAIQLRNSTPRESFADSDLTVSMDGVARTITAGSTVVLEPGESITLPPRLYHTFRGLGSRVLVGEVSSVNDDSRDNRFYEPIGRFPSVEEDVPPRYLLCTDYPKYAKHVLS